MQAQLSESPFITRLLRSKRIQNMCDFVEHEVSDEGCWLLQGGQSFAREVAMMFTTLECQA